MPKPERLTRRAKHRADLVTGQQLAIFQLLAEGRSLQEAAEELGVSVHTARTHVKNARRRLGASTQGHAIAALFRAGRLS